MSTVVLPITTYQLNTVRDAGCGSCSAPVPVPCVIVCARGDSTSRTVSGSYSSFGLGVKRRPKAGTTPSLVMYGRGVPKLCLHDDVGQQVPHALYTVFKEKKKN